jgi:predicted RNase H-like HicB family nuclease
MTVARKSKHVRYTVILQEEADPDFVGYYNAIVPALPGCFSYGASREEALANVKEAIQVYLEDLEAGGEPIPVEHIEQIGIEV